jgi:DNA-binding FadR family transcriptional regulator
VIGEAAQNYLLLVLLDTLNAVRRAVTWGRLRPNRERPAPDHHSFNEHEAIVDAIQDRDRNRAREAMRAHLVNVERNLLAS